MVHTWKGQLGLPALSATDIGCTHVLIPFYGYLERVKNIPKRVLFHYYVLVGHVFVAVKSTLFRSTLSR